MNTEAILARRPEICLVDEFPHTNVPGSPRAKRWEDVMMLLGAGIDVITTMNIQHLGKPERSGARDLRRAGARDAAGLGSKTRRQDRAGGSTPGALLNRLDRGVVYAPDKAQRAKENFFKEPTLAALRELALRQTAHEVDIRQPEALPATTSRTDASARPRQYKRILIHVTGPVPWR